MDNHIKVRKTRLMPTSNIDGLGNIHSLEGQQDFEEVSYYEEDDMNQRETVTAYSDKDNKNTEQNLKQIHDNVNML